MKCGKKERKRKLIEHIAKVFFSTPARVHDYKPLDD